MPSDFAKEYRVEVEMEAEPFAFDNSQPTILKGDDLEKIVKQSGGRKKTIEKKAQPKVETKSEKSN